MRKYHKHLTDEQEECLRGCSQQAQYDLMRRHFENGTCPLCHIDHNTNKILFEHERWLGWEVPNACTTRERTLHFLLLFFPREHLTFEQLDRAHLGDLVDIKDWVYKHYEVPGGGIVGRYGDMRHNVGTVPGHFHWGWFQPNREGSVIVPFAKDEPWIRKDTDRMIKHMEKYQGRA